MREIFKKSRGFGIIEAIIALAILGVALSAMMQSTTIMFNALKTDNNIIRNHDNTNKKMKHQQKTEIED